MADLTDAGRSLILNEVASITFFGISILAAIAQIAIRLRYRKRLFADDAFLFLAVVCLCISMALLHLRAADVRIRRACHRLSLA